MSDSPFGTIYTDHRVASGTFFAVDPNGVVSADDANSAVYRVGLDALFADRTFVKDDCDCDYCLYEPPS